MKYVTVTEYGRLLHQEVIETRTYEDRPLIAERAAERFCGMFSLEDEDVLTITVTDPDGRTDKFEVTVCLSPSFLVDYIDPEGQHDGS